MVNTAKITYTSTVRRLVLPGSWLNLPADNITDAMLEEGSEFYMVEEDTADNYLQLVEA